jgi:hypothetical protein
MGGVGEKAVVEPDFHRLEGVDAPLDGTLPYKLVVEDRLGGMEAAAAILNLTIFLINLWMVP